MRQRRVHWIRVLLQEASPLRTQLSALHTRFQCATRPAVLLRSQQGSMQRPAAWAAPPQAPQSRTFYLIRLFWSGRRCVRARLVCTHSVGEILKGR